MLLNHIGAVQLARVTGIPLSTIKNIRTGKNINPTIETIIPLANYFAITLDALIQSATPLIKPAAYAPVQHNAIPLLTWKSCIQWPIDPVGHALIYTALESHYALSFAHKDENQVGQQGTFIINATLKPRHLDYVIVHKKTAEEASIKQVVIDEEEKEKEKDDANGIYLKSVNRAGTKTAFNKTYKILGVIVEYRQVMRRSNEPYLNFPTYMFAHKHAAKTI